MEGFHHQTASTAPAQWSTIDARRKAQNRLIAKKGGLAKTQKVLREQLPAALAAHDRIYAESHAITAQHWGETGRYWCNWHIERPAIDDWRKIADSLGKAPVPRKQSPKPAPAAKPTTPAPVSDGTIALTAEIAFRLSGRELRELAPNPIATQEIARRKARRAEKRAAA